MKKTSAKLVLLLIVAFSIQAVGAQAQSGNTNTGPDIFFGYNGKKKNDSTLVTGGGAIIEYHQADNQLSVQLPPGSDPFKQMESTLNNTDNASQQDAAPFLKQIQFAPIAAVLTDAYKQVKEEYTAILSNTIQLPKQSAEDKANQAFAQNMLAGCPALEGQYNEIVDYIRQHKHDRTFNVPPPPAMDYENCWSCHPSKQVQYDTLVARYTRNAFEQEIKLIKEALGMAQTRSLLGMDQGWQNDAFGQTLSQVLGSKSHPTACTWMFNANPWQAAQKLMQIAFNKADYLFDTYKGDFHRLPAVTNILLEFTKQYSLLTGGVGTDAYVIPKVRNAASNFFSTYTERVFIKEDFTQWSNMKFLFKLARQCAILGDETSDNTLIGLIQKYDSFKISIDVNCKLGRDGGYEQAHLQGDNYVALMPDDDTLQCLRMVEYSQDMITNGKQNGLKLKLLDAQVIASGSTPKFTGPYTWQTALPTFSLHDCDHGKDSLTVNPIYPAGYASEIWNYPKLGNTKVPIIQGMLGAAFMSQKEVDRMKDPAVQEQMKAKLMANAAQMQAMAAQMQRQMSAGGPTHSAQNMQGVADMIAMMHKSTVAMPDLGGKITFETSLNNSGPVMIDVTYNGKNDSAAKDALVYATYQLKVVLDRKR